MGGARAIRAFVGLELGDAARRQAAALAAAWRGGLGDDGIRWVRPEALHVTLRFLGPTDPARLPALVRSLTDAQRDAARFTLRLGAPDAFPARRPRVLALGLEPEAPLAALADAVERGAVAAGYAPEPRAFRPHVTLGRVRRERRLRRPDLEVEAVTASVTRPRDAWDVIETVLFRSDLSADGARYAPLERIPIGAEGPGPSDAAFHP